MGLLRTAMVVPVVLFITSTLLQKSSAVPSQITALVIRYARAHLRMLPTVVAEEQYTIIAPHQRSPIVFSGKTEPGAGT